MGDKNCCVECFVPEHDSEGEDYRGALPESCQKEIVGCDCHEERKLDVKHLPSDYPKDHYEVVWNKGEHMTKVDEHVYLK